jgi:hypothetical protein
MQNIDIKVTNGKAVITIDLSKRYGASASGKTIAVASTRGNQTIDGTNVILGLNAYVKP